MNTYMIGQVIDIAITVKTASGVLTDPAAVVVQVKIPGTPVPAAFTPVRTSTGVYHYDYEPTIGGEHGVRVATTSPDSAYEFQFFVEFSVVA